MLYPLWYLSMLSRAYSVPLKNLKILTMTHRWACQLIQLVAITWSISSRKFLITRVIQRNRHRCRSMSNGSTMITRIIYRNLGKISGSVKHSMYTWRIITCHFLSLRISRDQPSRIEFERIIC